jgi:hypothetical protein
MLIDAASYGVSALLLARVRRDVDDPAASDARFLADLRDGFAEVRSRTWVWATIVAFSLLTTFALAFPVLGAVVARRQLGGAGAWAAILVARAAGALIAGTSLLRLAPRRPLLVATLAGMVTALPTILLAIPAPLAVIAVGALVSGIGPMVFNTLWETTLQHHIPPSARSRVSAYDWLGSMALQPVGYALIGPLATAVGVPAALYLCGGVEFAVLALLLTVPDIRTLPPRPRERVVAVQRSGVPPSRHTSKRDRWASPDADARVRRRDPPDGATRATREGIPIEPRLTPVQLEHPVVPRGRQ